MASDKSSSPLGQCVEQVRDKDSAYSWRSSTRQCSRASVVVRDGRPLCKQHDPETIAAREAARQAQYRAEDKELRKRHLKAARDRAFVEACEAFSAYLRESDPHMRMDEAMQLLASSVISAQSDYERKVSA